MKFWKLSNDQTIYDFERRVIHFILRFFLLNFNRLILMFLYFFPSLQPLFYLQNCFYLQIFLIVSFTFCIPVVICLLAFLEYDCVFDPLLKMFVIWYFEPPNRGISNSLFMVYRTLYPWYCEPTTHGISILLPMVCWIPYPWYFDPLPKVYQTHYPW